MPCDIVILEMEEDSQIPIILGRPFLATAGAIIDMKRGKIKLEIGEEIIEFNVFKMTKDPSFIKTCFRVDAIQSCVEKIFRKQYPEDPLEASLTRDADSDDENPEVIAFTKTLNSTLTLPKGKSVRYDPLPTRNLHSVCALREEDAPKVELKQLPPDLRYAFLGPNSTYPIIVNAHLNGEQVDKLLRRVRDHRKIIGYTIDDLKGISPSFCMHRIHLEEGCTPTIEH